MDDLNGWEADVADYAEEHACPACGDEDHNFLGNLGRRAHFRCRGCGMDYSHEVE